MAFPVRDVVLSPDPNKKFKVLKVNFWLDDKEDASAFNAQMNSPVALTPQFRERLKRARFYGHSTSSQELKLNKPEYRLVYALYDEESESITGYVGLLESVYMIADGLDWELDKAVECPPEPVIDEKEVETGLGWVEPGCVIGLTSVVYGQKGGKDIITLEFCANAAVEEEYDEIIVEGEPQIHQKIIGGVHGDIGTVAVTINTIPRAIEASSGFILMKDLPLPRAVL